MAVALALFVAAVQWINSAHVNIGSWSKGVPSNPAAYIPLAAVIVLLILPEVKVELPGVRLELRHQREDVQRIAGQVQAIQNSLVQVASSRSLAIASGASTADLVQALAPYFRAEAAGVASEEQRKDDTPASDLPAFTPPGGGGGVDL